MALRNYVHLARHLVETSDVSLVPTQTYLSCLTLVHTEFCRIAVL